MSKAASYSRVGLYEKCPASYEWQYVLDNKAEFIPGPAALRGLEIHKSIEDYFFGTGVLHVEIPQTVVPWILEHYERNCEARPEMAFAFTREWEPCDFDSEDCYVRGYMDNVFIYEDRVFIHEYKTGQIYDDHADQKQLYAMAGLLLFPHLDQIEVKGIYIDKKKQFATQYSRKYLHSIQYTWKKKIDKLALPMYPARPGMHCRWCPKSNKTGGPCQVG